jgi:Ca2+-binding EF-hand superfamily protein
MHEKIKEKTVQAVQRLQLDQSAVHLYEEIFSIIDYSESHAIGRDEMKFGLKIAKMELSDKDFDEIWNKVIGPKKKKRAEAEVDFSEFLDFLIELKGRLEGCVFSYEW